METVSLSVALAAGALATINPCGFPLLPAFLSYYVAADERALPPARTRVLQGLAAGALVAAGFVGVFAAAGLPVAFGVRAIAEALPWAGAGIGVLLMAVGGAVAFGRKLSLSLSNPVALLGAGLQAPLLFGIGYAVASLGCTLPIFLALVAASLASASAAHTLAVFAAYAAGTATILTALALAASLLRQGIARGLRRLLPHMTRVAGVLLFASGAYLMYYWLRIELGPASTLADDPFVGSVTRQTARIQAVASEQSDIVVAGAASVLVLAFFAVLWQWHRSRSRRPVEAR